MSHLEVFHEFFTIFTILPHFSNEQTQVFQVYSLKVSEKENHFKNNYDYQI